MVTITKASAFAVIDELGVDPLRDKSFDAIHKVQSFQWYLIKAEEEHNGPLIAYNVGLNEHYWRLIMMYNDIPDMFSLKAGMRIKIPSFALISSALNDVLTDYPERTVRI
jgi:hypothetical protein